MNQPTTTHAVTLKAFKHIKAMSEETLCFTAAVLVNGTIVGHAENRGHGGCTFIFPVNPAADLKHLVDEVDRLACEMVDSAEMNRLRKKVAKDLATTVIFTRKGDAAGSFRTLKKKHTTAEETIATAKAFAATQTDIECVLNLLPFEQAFALLVKVN